MTDAEARTKAIDEVLAASAACEAPALDYGEVEALVDSCRVARTYATATAYAFGEVVHPPTANGHAYRCVKAGLSGAGEPAWPTRDFARVSDGAVTWEEAGPAGASVYDIRRAVHRAWTAKMAKAAKLTRVAAGEVEAHAGEVFEHCREMARRYAPAGVS